MSEQELLPCPFCGGDVQFGYFAITPNIHCDTCQFEIDGDPDRSDELINRWNTRADLAQAAVAAALERAAKAVRQDCLECEGSGMRDSGGETPWGQAILVPCDCDLPIRSLIPDDAQAALDDVRAEERERCAERASKWFDEFVRGNAQMASFDDFAAALKETTHDTQGSEADNA